MTRTQPFIQRASFPPLPEETEPAAEVLLLEEDDPLWQEQDSPETARELEARMIAMRIRELMEAGQVTDKDSGELRKVKVLGYYHFTQDHVRMVRDF